MKVYAAIGHFKGSKNTLSVAMQANNKKSFVSNLFGNEFVPYVILTESMLQRIKAMSISDDDFAIWNQVKKLTTNYRIWSEIANYFDQCLDILEEKVNKAHQSDF